MSVVRSVDVIVPSYNYSRFLNQCVGSLLGQRGVAVRVLVIDDASSDDTEQVAVALCRSDSRVEYRRHSHNLGHVRTYNEGMAWVSADYLLLISADDLLTDGALERAVMALDACPTAVFAHGRQIVFDERPIEPIRTIERRFTLQSGRDFITTLSDLGHNPVATPTVVVRTSAQRVIGEYNPGLPHTNDLEMWLRLALHGDVVALDACQAFKRQHGENMQLQYLRGPERDVLERSRAFDSFFSRSGSALPNAKSLHARARHALAAELFWEASRLFDSGRDMECRALLNISLQLDPGISTSSSWRRLTVKRHVGVRLWGAVRKVAAIAPLPNKLAQRH